MGGQGSGGGWFVRARPRPAAELRLFCFPHAGGAASSYFAWAGALEAVDVLAVQPPGREGRLAYPPIADTTTPLDRLDAPHTPQLARPYVFFAPRLGAIGATEPTRELLPTGLPT